MNGIKVSVIVPVYNSEEYIKDCIESLVNQSLKDIEIIVINDGSVDNSKDILNNYEKKYKDKVKVLHTKNNGIGIARNLGLKKAKGEFLFFLDSDDYLDKNALEKMYDYAINKKSDLVVCDMYRVFEKENKIIETIYFKDGNLINNKKLIFQIPLGPCGKLFLKKNITNTFAENLKYEDVPFVASAIKNSSNISKIDESLYYYRIHNDSETTSMDKRVFDILKILDITNNLFENFDIKEELEYLNIQLLSRYNLQQKYQKSKALAEEFLDKSFLFLNNNFKNWKKNKYLRKRNIFKRIIETNKKLIKLYWKI